MIKRDISSKALQLAGTFPAVTITGPRQSGKSTLCRALFPEHDYVNLELPDVRAFVQNDPKAFLDSHPRGGVIDEVQRCPDLLSYLQVRIDEDPAPGRWILTGSQNLLLLSTVSQSLAGRTSILHLLPLSLVEARRFDGCPDDLDEVLLTGGYPAIFDRCVPPMDWLASYVATYVERDVRTITNIGDLSAFQRFLSLCAGRTGQLLNLSALAGDAGISQPTAKSWLSILETSFLVFRLQPYHTNLRKRIVKMPKLHFYDTGLVCWLLGIRTAGHLRNHPLRGAIFETWVVSQILKGRMNLGENRGVFFFRDQRGNEADIVIDNAGSLQVIEVKAGRTISEEAVRCVQRQAKFLGGRSEVESIVIHGGEESQRRSHNLRIVPWGDVQAV